MKLIILSVHDQPSVSRSVLDAGANGFVVKRALATDLLAATDAVLAGQLYVSALNSYLDTERKARREMCLKVGCSTASQVAPDQKVSGLSGVQTRNERIVSRE